MLEIVGIAAEERHRRKVKMAQERSHALQAVELEGGTAQVCYSSDHSMRSPLSWAP